MSELKYYRMNGGGILGVSDGPPPGAIALEVGIEPTGDWRPAGAFGALESRDGLRGWRDLATGEVTREVVRNYFTRATRSGDICLYCGWDNGPHGESRCGWDCGYCGSN